jgi:hypothetical protein
MRAIERRVLRMVNRKETKKSRMAKAQGLTPSHQRIGKQNPVLYSRIWLDICSLKFHLLQISMEILLEIDDRIQL